MDRIEELKKDIEWAENEIEKLRKWVWYKRVELSELTKNLNSGSDNYNSGDNDGMQRSNS